MLSQPSRRDILQGAALACAGDFAFLRHLPVLSAQEVQNPARAKVQLNPPAGWRERYDAIGTEEVLPGESDSADISVFAPGDTAGA